MAAHVKRRLSVHAEAESSRLCIYPSIASHSQDTYSSCPRTRPRVSQALCVYAVCITAPIRARVQVRIVRIGSRCRNGRPGCQTGICATVVSRAAPARNLKSRSIVISQARPRSSRTRPLSITISRSLSLNYFEKEREKYCRQNIKLYISIRLERDQKDYVIFYNLESK